MQDKEPDGTDWEPEMLFSFVMTFTPDQWLNVH